MALKRSIAAAVVVLLLAAAAGIAFIGIWQREHPGEKLIGKSDAFPRITGVTSIRVLEVHREGNELINEIEDAGAIADTLAMLARAQRTSFGDPEPLGQLYQVEFRQGSRSLIYEINDLRGTGSTIQGKIYPQNPQPGEVWYMPQDAIDRLVVKAEPA